MKYRQILSKKNSSIIEIYINDRFTNKYYIQKHIHQQYSSIIYILKSMNKIRWQINFTNKFIFIDNLNFFVVSYLR